MKFKMLLFFLLIHLSLYAADVKVPINVAKKIEEMFPEEKSITWFKKRGKYRANFIYHNHNMCVLLNRKAKVIEVTEEIDLNALPRVIGDKINAQYDTFKLVMAQRQIIDNVLFYLVEIIKGELQYVLRLTEKGSLLKKYNLRKEDVYYVTPSI